MAHGVRIQTVGTQGTSVGKDVAGDSATSYEGISSASGTYRIGRQPDDVRAPDSRSGTWKITWHSSSNSNHAYLRTFHSLFERQLNSFTSPRVFLLGDVPERDLAALQSHAAVVAVGEASGPSASDFDVVWDAGLLSRVQLPERLKLVQTLDAKLKIGGTCVVVTHDQRAADGALGYSLSPEEIAAYFFPAYVVARHEEHEFALPPGSPVAFNTLTLVKQSPLTSEMLDVELHRSLHAVAARRRGLAR